ncbi:MAG: class I SAM-dependent methyltransferase [Planctomycetota bacterium JB042]
MSGSHPSLMRRVAAKLGLASDPWAIDARERASGYYDSMYAESEQYDRPYFRSHYYFLWTVIVDRIRRRRPAKVLEVGCGVGQFAEFLVAQGGVAYTGFDFSPQAIEKARAKRIDGARFEVGDALETDLFETVEHDRLVCTEVLEHVERDLDIVARIRPGTRCICTVPNFPYESHVRHFADAAEVEGRYGEAFDDLDVFTLEDPAHEGNRFFLLEGTKRA